MGCGRSTIAYLTLLLGCHAPADSWRLVPTAESPLPGVRRANAIRAGDFNRDHRPDLAVLGGDPGELLVLLNQGSCRFTPSGQGVLMVGRTASGLDAGDVDGDGSCDVVISHHDDFEILVLLSRADGSLRPAPGSPVISARDGTPHSHSLVLADVNEDGKLDIVQAQAEKDAILVLLGDGSGGFSAASGSPLAAGDHPYTAIVADFDGDGAADVAAPNAEGQDLTIGLGDGRGGFTAARGPRPRLDGRGLGLAAGDLDGDGRVDLVANCDDQSTLGVLLGSGSGAFRPSPERLTAPGRCFGQAVADLDGDGIVDVAAPSIDAGAVRVWLGPGGAGGAHRVGAQRVVTFATPGTDSQVMALADLDGDGWLDVATAGWEEGTVTVLAGRAPRESSPERAR